MEIMTVILTNCALHPYYNLINTNAYKKLTIAIATLPETLINVLTFLVIITLCGGFVFILAWLIYTYNEFFKYVEFEDDITDE